MSSGERVELTSDSTGGFTVELEGALDDEYEVLIGAEAIPIRVASTLGDETSGESSSSPSSPPKPPAAVDDEESLACSGGEPHASGHPIPVVAYEDEEGRYPPLPRPHPDSRCAAFENEAECRIEVAFAEVDNSCSDATDCDALPVPSSCAFNDCQQVLPVAVRNLQYLEAVLARVDAEVCGTATDLGCEFPSASCPSIALTVQCIEHRCTAVYEDGSPNGGP